MTSEARMVPERPRLSEHVLVRQHRVNSVELVVLHDERNDEIAQIGTREWTLLRCADGTRDLEGIVAAASVEGAHATEAALAEFLTALDRVGWLESGPPPRRVVSEPAPIADRPIDPLAGFSFHCDGQGACCHSYGTVTFLPIESLRARTMRPELFDAALDASRLFAPLRGARFDAASAATMVDGHCAYLADDGRCSLHALGGAEAKPLGCRMFPAELVDDGEAIRVAPRFECACIPRSHGREGGAPLVDATRGSELPPRVHVRSLPEQIASMSRSEIVAWRRAALAETPEDVAAWFASRAGGDIDPRFVEALCDYATGRARAYAAWRGERDFVRRASRNLAAAAERLCDPNVRKRVSSVTRWRDDEALYRRTLLHAYQFVDPQRPLAVSLMDRAVRVAVARCWTCDDPEPSDEHPLAIVEALMTGHAMRRYLDRVASAP